MEPTAERSVTLPAYVGEWTADGALRRIDAATIFDYMAGSGELYLAYRFGHLDVQRYGSTDLGDINVELYWMGGTDDAYGLMSEDWTGEAWTLGPLSAESRHALYGAGLLRLASGALYARVLADRDTPQARVAIRALGRAIVASGPAPSSPALVDVLPGKARPGGGRAALELQPDRTRFLRSSLILNSAYYLSPDDVLGLDRDACAVYAEYRPAGGDHTTRARVVVVRYDDLDGATHGLRRFQEVALGNAEITDGSPPARGGADADERWTAFELMGRVLVVVLDAPGHPTADTLLRTITGAARAAEEVP